MKKNNLLHEHLLPKTPARGNELGEASKQSKMKSTTFSSHICADMSILNRFDIGGDHRLMRAKICIDTQLEWKKLIEKKTRLTVCELQDKQDEYRSHIECKLHPMEELKKLEINEPKRSPAASK